MNFTGLPPLGLYIHLPWCERKCPYCDFNSYQADDFDDRAYARALIQDLQTDLPMVWGRQIHSIFFGGGTPSLFSAEAIDQLLSDLRACLNLNPSIEITLEANPGSADAGRFRDYHGAGVNRLSLGIQSFDDAMLNNIGRIHDGDQARTAIELARQAGFENFNLDLMYGLPGQSPQQAMQDIEQAIAFDPTHISHYQLGIEPNTLFHSRTPDNLPDDEVTWQMQEQTKTVLTAAGYAQYEISAWARDGRACQHNLNYWNFGDYLGLGAGAHGKLTLPAENRVLRTERKRQPREWQQLAGQQAARELRPLDESDLVFEFMLNALRLVDGFDKTLFVDHCGLPWAWLKSGITEAVQRGLMEETGTHIRPSALGLRFHNDLQGIFLETEPPKPGQVEIFPRLQGN